MHPALLLLDRIQARSYHRSSLGGAPSRPTPTSWAHAWSVYTAAAPGPPPQHILPYPPPSSLPCRRCSHQQAPQTAATQQRRGTQQAGRVAAGQQPAAASRHVQPQQVPPLHASTSSLSVHRVTRNGSPSSPAALQITELMLAVLLRRHYSSLLLVVLLAKAGLLLWGRTGPPSCCRQRSRA